MCTSKLEVRECATVAVVAPERSGPRFAVGYPVAGRLVTASLLKRESWAAIARIGRHRAGGARGGGPKH